MNPIIVYQCCSVDHSLENEKMNFVVKSHSLLKYLMNGSIKNQFEKIEYQWINLIE